MTRTILSFLSLSVFVGLMSSSGCQVSGIGDPCTPDEEYVSNFAGFELGEVNVESKSFQCRTRLCLANHFQGRVSCPYGQDATGKAPASLITASPNDPNVNGCVIPGTTIPIDPTCAVAVDTEGATCPQLSNGSIDTLNPLPKSGKTVLPQCFNRTANDAVYCSCRCANETGGTGDGANYCSCPDGYTCKPPNNAPLVSSIGAGDTGLTGFYCYKNNTLYDPSQGCSPTCDPVANPCPNGY